MYNIFRILIGVPGYSSSSFFFNEEEAIPPPPDKQNKYQYNRLKVPDYSSSSSFFFMKRKLSPPPPDKQNTPGILYRNTNTTG